jgi:glutaredoxin
VRGTSLADRWDIIGTKSCKWCYKAQALLEGKNLYPNNYYDVGVWPFLRTLLKKAGINTVPQIFINGELIGGYDDLEEYLKTYAPY